MSCSIIPFKCRVNGEMARMNRFFVGCSFVINTRRFLLLLLFLSSCCFSPIGSVKFKQAPYTEAERQAEFKKRGHQWPIPEYVPNTPGWARLMNKLFSQVGAIGTDDSTSLQEKWWGWTNILGPALTIVNYTEYGWGLTHASQKLTNDLRQAIWEGLPNARLEGELDAIQGPSPLFIDRPDLTKRVSNELQPILEAWSGIKLVPSIAYGFRLYRNESRLWMHADKPQTHVISCIYHIASSDDSDPWPIILEDFAGNTNSVRLKPGDILLYESSKVFHGRPIQFKGSWYTSIFVHFYPDNDDWNFHDHTLEPHYAIPPDWRNVTSNDSGFPKLRWIGTNMFEPECQDYWCNLKNAIELEGPGEYGFVLTGEGKRYPLNGVINQVTGEL